jgi:hypothetical protein
MPTLTDVAANASLDAMGALYVRPHTADPTDAGTAAGSANFATRIAASLGAATARARSNTAECKWPTVATVAETISHVSLWDAATGGTCRWRGPLTAPVAVPIGDLFRLPPASLTIGLP